MSPASGPGAVAGEEEQANAERDRAFAEKSATVEVLEAALWAIVNLACDENIARVVGAAGGCDAILQTLAVVMDHEDACWVGCWALRNLSNAGALNYSLFVSTPCCEIVLDALRRYPHSQLLAEAGLWVVANLACEKTLAARFCALGAPEVVLNAARMLALDLPVIEGEDKEQRHIRTGPIVEAVLYAIRNLTHEDQPSLFAVSLGAAGACEIVADVFREYLYRGGMAVLSCTVLGNLISRHPPNGDRILSAGVLNTAIEILKLDPESDLTAATALEFVATCAGAHDGCRSMLHSPELNACGYAVATMKAHNGSMEVASAGCQVLLQVHYADSDAQREELAERGLYDAQTKRAELGGCTNIEALLEAWGAHQFEPVTLSTYSPFSLGGGGEEGDADAGDEEGDSDLGALSLSNITPIVIGAGGGGALL